MTLFTVGPVEMYPETLRIMGSQEPYFRTQEFSDLMLEIESAFLGMVGAPAGSRFALLTSSGTGGMEAVVSNILTPGRSSALVVESGSFGARFGWICDRFGIDHERIALPLFEGDLTEEALEEAALRADALFVQGCETSTGRKFDLGMIGRYCRSCDTLLVVDAISAFLADDIDMEEQGIDVLITASQKALALAPGLALIVCSPKAAETIARNGRHHGFYFDLMDYFLNQQRGQTPFTCAVSTVLSLHERLQSIKREGVAAEKAKHAERARYFRGMLSELGFGLPPIPLSNSCTPLLFPEGGATQVYHALRDRFGLTLCPSGGDLRDSLLRVGHLGNLLLSDYDKLREALEEVAE